MQNLRTKKKGSKFSTKENRNVFFDFSFSLCFFFEGDRKNETILKRNKGKQKNLKKRDEKKGGKKLKRRKEQKRFRMHKPIATITTPKIFKTEIRVYKKKFKK